MKSRIIVAVTIGLAAIATLGGLVLSAKARASPPPANEFLKEYGGMCTYCQMATVGACYEYDKKPGEGGGCTYPPCTPPPIERYKDNDGFQSLKLACASCRAMCSCTKGSNATYCQ